MTAATIQKYKGKTTAELKKKAQIVFNAWIRKRDAEKRCVSCPGKVEQAGHFYSAGHYNHLRFDERNVQGQCIRCNYHLHGNLISYRVELEKRIGKEALEELDNLANSRTLFKDDRFYLIEIIEKYK